MSGPAGRLLRLLLFTEEGTPGRAPAGHGCPRVPLLQPLAQLVQADGALVALAVPAQRHRAALGLAVADHEHVRDLAQLRLADLAPDRLRAVVDLDAEAGQR